MVTRFVSYVFFCVPRRAQLRREQEMLYYPNDFDEPPPNPLDDYNPYVHSFVKFNFCTHALLVCFCLFCCFNGSIHINLPHFVFRKAIIYRVTTISTMEGCKNHVACTYGFDGPESKYKKSALIT